jgi:hypothetical protein
MVDAVKGMELAISIAVGRVTVGSKEQQHVRRVRAILQRIPNG